MAKKKRSASKPVDVQKQAEKRERRMERQRAEAKAKQLGLRRRRLRTAFVAFVGVVGLGAAIFFFAQRAIPSELPGVEKQATEGRGHTAEGETATYTSATPTSGIHNASAPRCGVLNSQLPAEFAVHALEHGTVVIWHQPTLDANVLADLRATVNRFDDRVILSPNQQLTDPVVATAWLRLKAYDGANPELEEFITTYRNRGPESRSCNY